MVTMICNKEQCTGCAACFNICPNDGIQMISDNEGFLYPEIDPECCDDCGLCKSICPVLNPPETVRSSSPQVYACWIEDEAIRFQSSSGGAFSALARQVFHNGGVVFGAAFNENMQLQHTIVLRDEELGRLRSSKYVQSEVGLSYREVRNHLREKKRVLFSGTPCQIMGLYSFMGKKDENLFTCDILCKGVPSPGLFAKYIASLESRYKSKVVNINFRHKRLGWRVISTVAVFQDGRERVLEGYEDSFMFAFSDGFSLRNSCYRCSHSSVNRCGDITLADFWGLGAFAQFSHSARNGVSLLLVNSEEGQNLLQETSSYMYLEKRSMKEATYRQSALTHPTREPKNRQSFFADYQKLEYDELAKTHLVDKGVKRLIKRVVPKTWLYHIRQYIEAIKGSPMVSQ